jgi:hypothetical protein
MINQFETFLKENAEWQAQEEQKCRREQARRADERQVDGSHYKDMPVQPWSVMEAVLTYQEFVGYLKGNIIKYSMRQGLKTPGDAEKAKHYMEKLAEVEPRY